MLHQPRNFVVLALLVAGCTGPSLSKMGNPPTPEFDTVWMFQPYSCPGVDSDTFGGYIREDQSAFAYGITMNGKPVWYMIYELSDHEIIQAWVDPDFDGDYDLYYDNGDSLVDAYPSPCDVIPSGPGSKI